MSLADFYARCWENRRLLSLMLELTYACDLKCDFCYNEKERHGDRLALEDYHRILREARAEGALFLTLTGGEPTLHPEFFAIGAFADRLGYSVRVKSNGHGLSKELVRRLRDEVNPYNVDLSIHGATTATHDGMTGVAGSFDRLLEAIRLLKEAGIRVRLKFPFTRRNEGEIERVFDLARTMEVKLDVFPEITPKDSGDLSPTLLMASAEGLRRMYVLMHGLASGPETGFVAEEETDRMQGAMETPFACGAGLSNMMVDPFGVVFACVAWRTPLGNLRNGSVREIWGGEAAERLRAQNREAGSRKRLNPDLEGELFCPGRACAQYGNPLTIYPDSVILASFSRKSKKL